MDQGDIFFFWTAIFLTLPAAIRPGPSGGLIPRGLLVFLAIGASVLKVGIGYLGFAAWLVLLGLPAFASARLVSRWLVGDFTAAIRIARWISVLHPDRFLRERARACCAVGRAVGVGGLQAGERVPSRDRLAPLIELEVAAWRGDWAEVLARVESAMGRGIMDVSGVLLKLRGLGETGQLASLDEHFDNVEPQLFGVGRSLARLYLGVFHGEEKLVEYLLTKELALMPLDWRRYWSASAAMAAGEGARAQAVFEELSLSHVPGVAQAAKARLHHPAAAASGLSPERAERIGAILIDEDRFEDQRASTPGCIKVLIGLNIAAFVLEEAAGGSTDGFTLFSLGALLPSSVVLEGEWWRLGTALFLHAGIAHLLFNMLALRSLAPFVVRFLGTSRALAVFFISGIGGFAAISWGTLWLGLDDHLVLGASGGVMGYVGATAAILHRAAITEGSPIARERLRAVGSIIVLQAFFDLVMPQTSGSAHLIGAALGWVSARLLIR